MADIREIVLDTETTGLEPPEHRVVEIGALELINHIPTGRTYHQYINPCRPMPAEAYAIHGISDEDLEDKPLFADIAADFVDFLGDGRLVIHNAPFDMKFLNYELNRASYPTLGMDRVTDTLAIARKRYPGAQNSLDALCRRFGIDAGRRVKHGALLDSELLADVYLELKGGRQSRFSLDTSKVRSPNEEREIKPGAPAAPRGAPRPILLTEAEKSAHSEFVSTLGDAPLWQRNSG